MDLCLTFVTLLAQGTVKDAGKVLESTGIAPSDVTKTASSAASTVTPFITKFFQVSCREWGCMFTEEALGHGMPQQELCASKPWKTPRPPSPPLLPY